MYLEMNAQYDVINNQLLSHRYSCTCSLYTTSLEHGIIREFAIWVYVRRAVRFRMYSLKLIAAT